MCCFLILFGGGLQSLRIAGAHCDAAAFRGESFGSGQSNSLTGRRYQGYTIFESQIHGE